MRITKDTTVWNAWIGFNASHSSGAMYFGLINIILAIFFFEVIGDSVLLAFINVATALFYLFLAKKYWFRVPLLGISVAAFCFVVGLTLILLQ